MKVENGKGKINMDFDDIVLRGQCHIESQRIKVAGARAIELYIELYDVENNRLWHHSTVKE